MTAIFLTLFTNVAAVGNAVNSLLPSPLGNSFNSIPMLAMATIGLSFAYLAYQRELSTSQQTSASEVRKDVQVSATGEIEDDEL